MLTCPDLVALAGDRYRVTWETPLDTRPSAAYRHDPWAAMVPCRGGDHIFPWGPDRLAVSLLGRRPGLTRLLVAAGCTVHTRGDDGITFTFSVELFGRVAMLTRAKKRRKLSDEQRARLAEAGAGFRFGCGAGAPETGLICPPGASVDILVLPAAPGAT